MTGEDFRARVVKRFPKINPETVAEISEEVKRYRAEDIYALWEHFDTFYTNVSPPHWGVFKNIAWKLDLSPTTAKIDAPKVQYEVVCYAPILRDGVLRLDHNGEAMYCLSSFSTEYSRCPKCGSRDAGYQGYAKAGMRPGRHEAEQRFAMYGRETPYPRSLEALKIPSTRPLGKAMDRVKAFMETPLPDRREPYANN